MISNVRLTNFKGHRDTNVGLRPMTALVGPNGSGKTSFLEALKLLPGVLREEIKNALPSGPRLEAIRHYHRREQIKVLAAGQWDGSPWSVGLEIPVSGNTQVDWVWKGQQQGLHSHSPLIARKLNGLPLEDQLRGIRNFAFEADAIANPAPLLDVHPQVSTNGSNLAPTLASIKLTEISRFERIVEMLKAVVPSVTQVRVEPAPMDSGGVGYRVGFDFRGVKDVPAYAASSGTLVTLALVTALHQVDAPKVVLIDELDHSLHPKAQMVLVQQLRRLVEAQKDLQIIATTHSPYILDAFELDEVRVFAARSDGRVVVKPLSQHPEAQRSGDALSPGQLWSLDDESHWVAGE